MCDLCHDTWQILCHVTISCEGLIALSCCNALFLWFMLCYKFSLPNDNLHRGKHSVSLSVSYNQHQSDLMPAISNFYMPCV